MDGAKVQFVKRATFDTLHGSLFSVCMDTRFEKRMIQPKRKDKQNYSAKHATTIVWHV